MGFGLFPTIFAMNFTWEDISAEVGGNNESALDPKASKLLWVFVGFMLLSFFLFGSDVFLSY